MIISASRRTDIPAFYAEWMIRRLRDGYCAVPNPFHESQVSRNTIFSLPRAATLSRTSSSRRRISVGLPSST